MLHVQTCQSSKFPQVAGECDCCTELFSATRKGEVKLVKLYRNQTVCTENFVDVNLTELLVLASGISQRTGIPQVYEVS